MSNTTAQTQQMQIVVNGYEHQVPGAVNLIELLEFLGIAADRVAIEMDGVIVRKQSWAETRVAPGSRFEIVQFVGGG